MLTYVPPFKVIARDEMPFLTFTLKFTRLSEILHLVFKTKPCKKSQTFQTLNTTSGKQEKRKKKKNSTYKDRHIQKDMA